MKERRENDARCFLSNKTVLFIFFLCCLFNNGSSAPTPFYNICDKNSIFSANSAYSSNLNRLLASLSASATNLNGAKFHNATVGGQPDEVYGVYLCRGDVTDAVCKDCVETASKESLEKCPYQKNTVMWYDQCMFRFSNVSTFSQLVEKPRIGGYNEKKADNPYFDQVVNDTVKRLINRAAYNSSGSMFATEEVKYNGSWPLIYSLVQCTPDISASDCAKCLNGAFSVIASWGGTQGARVLLPSCNLRYEVYSFYGEPPPGNNRAELISHVKLRFRTTLVKGNPSFPTDEAVGLSTHLGLSVRPVNPIH